MHTCVLLYRYKDMIENNINVIIIIIIIIIEIIITWREVKEKNENRK